MCPQRRRVLLAWACLSKKLQNQSLARGAPEEGFLDLEDMQVTPCIPVFCACQWPFFECPSMHLEPTCSIRGLAKSFFDVGRSQGDADAVLKRILKNKNGVVGDFMSSFGR